MQFVLKVGAGSRLRSLPAVDFQGASAKEMTLTLVRQWHPRNQAQPSIVGATMSSASFR
jgi:hypothetical protein